MPGIGKKTAQKIILTLKGKLTPATAPRKVCRGGHHDGTGRHGVRPQDGQGRRHCRRARLCRRST